MVTTELSQSYSAKRILVIPLRYIGDTILTVPLLRNLRQAFPHAEIDVMVSKTAKPLLEPCPYISKLQDEPKGLLKTVRFLKTQHYDTVLILRKSFTTALACKIAGIKYTIGYDKQRYPWGYRRWGMGLDVKVSYPSLKTTTPQAVSHLNFLQALGVAPADRYLALWTTSEDEQAIDELFARYHIQPTVQPLAVVHTVSASHGKSIEPERFLPAIEKLLQANYQVLFTGIASDSAGYDHLIRQNLQLATCVNLAGQTSLRQTVALYKRIQILLTVDSSPVHIGLAVGIPNILAVYGPTNHRQWGYYEGIQKENAIRFLPVYNDLDCRPCYAKTCEHNNCRVQLSAGMIEQGVEKLLKHAE